MSKEREEIKNLLFTHVVNGLKRLVENKRIQSYTADTKEGDNKITINIVPITSVDKIEINLQGFNDN